MPNSEKETIRRVLEAVLAKLDGEPRPGESDDDRTAPVIVILGGACSHQAQHPIESPQPSADWRERSATANSFAASANPQALHAGLERFPLAETSSHPEARKACFMEPDRTCVSSGACEMRGY